MTRNEHILKVLEEECEETAHRCSKALRFSLEEVQEGQKLSNADRIIEEFSQAYAMMEMLFDAGLIRSTLNKEVIEKKKVAFEKWLKHSEKQGTVNY